jgi:hypothetical protein
MHRFLQEFFYGTLAQMTSIVTNFAILLLILMKQNSKLNLRNLAGQGMILVWKHYIF